MREPRLRLQDILIAIRAIEGHAERGKEEFLRDPMFQTWVFHHLQNIGEAVEALRRERPEWLTSHPEVPWDEVVGMRNRLVHGYFQIRLDPVWEAVDKGLPVMKRVVSELLNEGA